MKIKHVMAFFAILWLISSSPAMANWTLNLGYHNPPVSTYGLNLLYFGQSLAFEVGLGGANVDSIDTNDDAEDGETTDEDTDDTATVALIGGLNVKYFFSKSGTFSPYLQGGFVAGLGVAVGKRTDVGAGLGGGYAGLGLLIGKPSFYAYLSGNLMGSHTFLQAGVGFDI